MKLKHSIVCLLAILFSSTTCSLCYATENIETKINELLGKMTLEEKIQMLSGDETGFNGQGVQRLEIPKVKMTDGPVGVRQAEATAFPVSINLAASWDTELAKRYGIVLARETKAKGKHVILGPCVGIHRFPLNGRNFESFGEDPFLSSRLGVSYIEGVQSQNVVATVKHLAANDQEWQRKNVDIIVDERAFREIHLPAFEYAVKEADVWAVMSSYNLVNGWHASENKHLLTDILKNEWGFEGLVMSDWVSVYSTEHAANNGLDVEMPKGVWFDKKLIAAVKDGKVTEEVINDKIRRHLRVRFRAGVFENPDPAEDPAVIRSDDHKNFAREVAQKSLILLKNEKVLPLDRSALKKFAVIGPNAKDAQTGGGGSSRVKPWHVVSPYDGISNLLGNNVEVTFAQGTKSEMKAVPRQCLLADSSGKNGLKGEYFNSPNQKGDPKMVRIDPQINFSFKKASPAKEIQADNFSVRWTGKLLARKSGLHVLGVASDDGSMLYIDGKLAVNNGGNHQERLQTCELELEAGKSYEVRIDYTEIGMDATVRFLWQEPGISNDPSLFAAVEQARNSDAVIICAGNNWQREGEGRDIPNFQMEAGQAELIKSVAAVNPKTVVVLFGGTPIYMKDWIDKVPGVILAMYPGQEGGDALAQILFGEVNPSGKLPFSYIQSKDETYAFDGYQDPSLKMNYKEGVFVGYRYYDKNGIDPLYEFGYGLSYTDFAYSDLKIKKSGELEYTATAKVKNVGKMAGDEIVQLYVCPPKSKVERPVKELKGFTRISLKPGESKTVEMKLSPRSFQYYDVELNDWAADSGTYQVLVGASSGDIKLKQSIELK